MVKDDLAALDACAEVFGGTVGHKLFEGEEFVEDGGAQEAAHRLGVLEIGDGVVNVVGEFAGFVRALVGTDGGIILHGEAEHGIDEEIGVGVGGDASELETGGALVALGQADDGRAVVCGDADAVGGFERGIEAAVAVDGAVGDQAEIACVIEKFVDDVPAEGGELAVTCGVVHQVAPFVKYGEVGMHAGAVDFHHRFGKKRCRETAHGGNLAGEELVELDLVACHEAFRTAVVEFELGRGDFGMIFFVFKAEGALGFRKMIDEEFEGAVGEGVEIAAVGDVIKTVIGLEILFRVDALEKKSFDLKGDLCLIAAFGERVGIVFEEAARVSGVGGAVDILDKPEDHDLARPEDVAWQPAETAPVDGEAEVAFSLLRKTVDRRTVESQRVMGLFEEFLVVVEHMEAAFEVRKTDGHGFQLAFVVEIAEIFFTQGVVVHVVLDIRFGFEIQGFEFVVRNFFEIAYFDHKFWGCACRGMTEKGINGRRTFPCASGMRVAGACVQMSGKAFRASPKRA